AGWVLEDFFRNPISNLGSILLSALVFIVGGGSGLVFVSMPYVFSNFYVRAWARIRSAFGKQYSEQQSWAITGITIALCSVLFVGVQTQPQVQAFELLQANQVDDAPAMSAEQLVAQRRSQLDNAATIRSGLTNAYLYRYRYLSSWSQRNALKELYRNTLQLQEAGAQFFQTIHNGLLSPFLYRGDQSDVERASELYAQVFDQPIQKAERSAIRTALQATANRDETSAGVLDLDQEIVYLDKQSVTITEQGDWATVEIHEQYQNPTFLDQEIFYSFSLPESAAITGLWLGNAANPKLFPFVVSPRGAAQQVYNGEVERGQIQQAVDPALLEQVGPRQYRLRVYPIPAAIPAGRDRTPPNPSAEQPADNPEPGPGELHLWMTYQVIQQNGEWPLPQLTEKRSIYWTDETTHLRGDRQVTLANGEWFEASVPAKRKAKAQAHSLGLAEGYQVSATPLTAKNQQLPTGKQFAIVIDSSYSMGQHTDALKRSLDQLKSIDSDNTLDFYLPIAGPLPESANASAQSLDLTAVDPAKILFYGSLQPADMLQQFATQRGDKAYDAVLLLTDEGSYELAEETALPDIDEPLWIVHVNGKVPSAYEDALLQQLQVSKGGVETDVTAALQRIALAATETTALDGYIWDVENISEADQLSSDTTAAEPDSWEAIAVRQLIAQQARTLDVTQVAALDEVHAIAQRTGIVTPYSSMLVLVDERQKELLKEAEAAEDRFEREVEDGEDALTQPGNPLTASVPEPGQVLGLMVGAIALIFLKRSGTHKQRIDR
ncbi:MAG: TIGR02921 family PEP-CTERM protein, partial [Phormidesmis sp.]